MATITFKNPILLSELDENTNLETFYEINEFVQMIKQGGIMGITSKHLLFKGHNNRIDVYQKSDSETKIMSANFKKDNLKELCEKDSELKREVIDLIGIASTYFVYDPRYRSKEGFNKFIEEHV